MFALAGLWNLGIGLTGLFFTDFSVALFYGPAAVTDDFLGLVSFRLFMVAIVIFGIGYLLVSRELMLNRAVVWLGFLCKVILFLLFLYFFLNGKATLMAMLALTGDFAWSLLFGLFLYQTRERVKHDIVTG